LPDQGRIKDRAHEYRRVPSRGIRWLLALVCCSISLGCATPSSRRATSIIDEPPSSREILANAPGWVTNGCRFHWKNEIERREIVCGVGSAGPNRNQVAARETAVARARSEIARSVTVTIESLVRHDDRNDDAGEFRSIAHQLTSASLPGCQVESVWQASTGEIHALVSLQVAKVQHSVRQSRALRPSDREDLARRAADAFAAMNAIARGEPDDARSPLRGRE
jgi:hypothetical protein